MLTIMPDFSLALEGFEERKGLKPFSYEDMRIAPYKLSSLSRFSTASPQPPSPGFNETSEYLIGSAAFAVILLESNGTIDPETENWDSIEIFNVRSRIDYALNWWSSQNPNASLSFIGAPPGWAWNVTIVETSYEPINRPSTDEGLWIGEAMTNLGFPGANYFNQTLTFINFLRDYVGTDWAFVIFIVDSSNDPDGSFADGFSAYAYYGGPFFVMTYDNGGWGIANMDRVTAHEMGHTFFATDEYNGVAQYSGYLNVSDIEGSRCLMDNNTWALSSGTLGQVGWRDSDGDGIQDIVDTFPDTVLNPYSPDPTTNTTLTYTGTVTEIPYPNNNPYIPPPPRTGRRDVTINTIIGVIFRVDGGAWTNATPDDGAFDESEESFSFTTPLLTIGTHTIEALGINSVGNVETTYASDTVTVTSVGDFDGDFDIDYDDIVYFVDAYIKYWSGQGKNAVCDLDNDCDIDYDDILIFVDAYIYYWTT